MTSGDLTSHTRNGFRISVLHHPWQLWLAIGALLLGLSLYALRYSAVQFSEPALSARVYHGPNFSGASVPLPRDNRRDPVRAARLAGLDPSQPFSIEWQGSAVAMEDGAHHFRAVADGGVAFWVDDTLLFERFAHGRQDLSAPIVLTRGLHRLRIRYAHFGGSARLRVSWARPGWRENFQAIPVLPATQGLVFRRLDKALRYPTLVAVAWSIWILIGLVLALTAGLSRMTGVRLAALRAGPGLALAGLAVLVLGFGIEIGTAPWRGWAPDELLPKDVLYAVRQGFANGWSDLYPPLHFYVLSAVISPFLLLTQWDWLDVYSYDTRAVIHWVGRLVSVVLGLMTLGISALLAEATIGRRVRLYAPVFLLSVPIFVFYSKTTNVDIACLFWVAVAMLFFVKAVTSRALADHAALGGAVALALASKDQAYGFFPAAALILLVLSWKETSPAAPWTSRMFATMADRRLWAGATAFAVVYALVMGALWNIDGLAGHFEVITGTGSQPFRMFPSTPSGTTRLGWTTLLLLPSTLGPGCAVFAGIGAIVVAANPRRFSQLLLLTALLIGYFLCFVAVVGYVYDRFLLGAALVAALFAAVGMDAALGGIHSRRARTMAMAGCLALALLPAAILNYWIAADSRLRLERWMQTHLRDDPLVLGGGLRFYLPNLHPYQHVIDDQPRSEALLAWNADVIVINEQWLAREGPEAAAVFAHALRTAGYEKQLSIGRGVEQRWPGGIEAFGLPHDPKYSNLAKINPPLSLWRRASADRAE